MIHYFTLFLIVILTSCNFEESKREFVVIDSDLQNFLKHSPQDRLLNAEADYYFWLKKLDEIPQGYIYLQKAANASLKLFEITGKPKYLELNKDLLQKASLIIQGKNQVNNLLLLSHAEMMLHNFKAAVNYSVKARSLTDEKFGPLMMQYDGEIELGNYQIAYQLLNRAKQPESVDYLIRFAKFKDHIGQLDSAIYYCEKALKFVESPEKRNWIVSNLGDLYGHAGLIKRSYTKYIEALSYNPNDFHALRGIIWIAFSYDQNYPLAKKLCQYLISNSANPEYLLLLADINEAMGQIDAATMHRNSFINKATFPIYNSYLIPTMAEVDSQKAVELALTEVDSRPTPEMFSLLAWAYYKNGENQKAIWLLEDEVKGRTHEPLAIYRMAMIYKEVKEHQKSDLLFQEVIDAEFEVGPNIMQYVPKDL
ncbi:hypothetical protein [Ekhidna sp.]|uniref:tetratricopeptide repeat protein n=2 Tax=Ekhidna sp. TaxID=2608089 RepID=UPI00329910D2